MLVLSLRSPAACCHSQYDVQSGCAQLVHHAAKFVSVPTLLAVARASLHFLQAELRGVVYWLNLLRHCEASLEQLTWDAEKLDREHADEAVLLNRQAKENKLLKEQSNMQERMEEVVESLPRLQQTTETLVSNIGGMCAAPCWAPHFFKLAKDSDGCCSPNHSVPDMATTMAALHEAHLLSDRTLDFIKSCFVTHELMRLVDASAAYVAWLLTDSASAEVAAHDVMAEEEQTAAKAAAKKAKKQNQKAKKQRAPQ
ncbi:TPA: hypothetical protein ACH3X1_012540 [Trebouxia sp. C0004]